MFFVTEEMVNKMKEAKNKKLNIPSFKEYYEKRYSEELKYFAENPRFSLKYMMIVSNLRKAVKTMALKEYKSKYPNSKIIDFDISLSKKTLEKKIKSNETISQESNIKWEQIPTPTPSDVSEVSEIEYDMLDDEISNKENKENKEKVKPIRRSSRLKNKSN